jgi:hypothetical protein
MPTNVRTYIAQYSIAWHMAQWRVTGTDGVQTRQVVATDSLLVCGTLFLLDRLQTGLTLHGDSSSFFGFPTRVLYLSFTG